MLQKAPISLSTRFWDLSSFFVTEKGLAYCATVAIVMVLNAMGEVPDLTPEKYFYKIFNQANLFDNNAVLESGTKLSRINHSGLQLGEAYELSKQYEQNVSVVYSSSIGSLDAFRSKLKNALIDGFVVINFDRKGINEVGGGHFSPIAAYSPDNDRFLMMDVARYKYPSVWVTAADLFRASLAVDKTSNKSRGLLIFKEKANSPEETNDFKSK